MPAWFYILRLKSGALYVGATSDLENRMRQRGVARPLYFEGPMAKAEALKRERNLKGWSRAKKLMLITEGAGRPK